MIPNISYLLAANFYSQTGLIANFKRFNDLYRKIKDVVNSPGSVKVDDYYKYNVVDILLKKLSEESSTAEGMISEQWLLSSKKNINLLKWRWFRSFCVMHPCISFFRSYAFRLRIRLYPVSTKFGYIIASIILYDFYTWMQK